ncbi:uncharacterized protein [Lepisosteus oculatus]|uniref:uncharacterized protein n=1 Tax=Lepisosteus oculatus TaxID=7918 RepID=UPI00073FE04B|nr:PREDICTED: uncharacterized protein LOC107078807 [Lepisosteus oculatus]
MDQLYSCLRKEIASFETHVQVCKEAFDLDTLKHVLSVLTESYQGEIESLDVLWHLAGIPAITNQVGVNITVNNGGIDLQGYISWLCSFIEHLRSMKETFDDKVVIPLCESLYVNDEGGISECFSDMFSPLTSLQESWTKPKVQPKESIAKVANELFILRRRWALLLTPGPIKAENFNPQSAPKEAGGVLHFGKILWLVPDIVYKSLLAANLASQWVDLYQMKYSDQKWPKHSFSQAKVETSNSPNLEKTEHLRKPSSFLKIESGNGQGERMTDIKAKLRNARMELMALRWREERAKILEQQITQVLQKVKNIRIQLKDKKNEMDHLKQLTEWEARDEQKAEMLNQKYKECLNQIRSLEQHLKLEEYHENILQGDMMLELEIRPSLIRQIEMIQDRCKELEEKLKFTEYVKNSPEALQELGKLTPDTHSIISNCTSLFSLK